MKACLLTSIAGNGGSAATAFHNAVLLQRAGWEVTLFAPGEHWPERGRQAGLNVRTLELRRGFHPLSFAHDYRNFRRYLRTERPDVAIVQKSPEQWLAAAALQGVRGCALVRLRGVVFAIRPNAANRWLHNRMDLVVCSASVIARQYEQLPGFDRANVVTLLEGVDTKRFRPATPEERRAQRERFGLEQDALVIGTAGRPSAVKGHDVLVRAFAQAFAEHPQKARVQLAIFADESRRGPGSYGSLGDLCQELKIADRARLIPGFVPEMADVYRALDAYILPSRGSEGSSRAGLEASASGLPLIASRVGVLPDLIRDGETGVLVAPDDVAGLAGVLRELAERWPAAQALGRAARARMETELEETQYAQRLTGLLQRAVAHARGETTTTGGAG